MEPCAETKGLAVLFPEEIAEFHVGTGASSFYELGNSLGARVVETTDGSNFSEVLSYPTAFGQDVWVRVDSQKVFGLFDSFGNSEQTFYSLDNTATMVEAFLPNSVGDGGTTLYRREGGQNTKYAVLVEEGTIYLTVNRLTNANASGPLASDSVGGLYVIKSPDGGVTWSDHATLTEVSGLSTWPDEQRSNHLALFKRGSVYTFVAIESGGMERLVVWESSSLAGPWVATYLTAAPTTDLDGTATFIGLWDGKMTVFLTPFTGDSFFLQYDSGWSVSTYTPAVTGLLSNRKPVLYDGSLYRPYIDETVTFTGIIRETAPGVGTRICLPTLPDGELVNLVTALPGGIAFTTVNLSTGGGSTYTLDLYPTDPTEEEEFSPEALGEQAPVLRRGPTIRTINDNALRVQEALTKLADIDNTDGDVPSWVLDLNGNSLVNILDDTSPQAVKIRS